MRDHIGRPFALISGVVAGGGTAHPAILQRPWRGDLLLGEHAGYLGRTVSGKAELVYLPDYQGAFLVADETLVLALCTLHSVFDSDKADAFLWGKRFRIHSHLWIVLSQPSSVYQRRLANPFRLA